MVYGLGFGAEAQGKGGRLQLLCLHCKKMTIRQKRLHLVFMLWLATIAGLGTVAAGSLPDFLCCHPVLGPLSCGLHFGNLQDLLYSLPA